MKLVRKTNERLTQLDRIPCEYDVLRDDVASLLIDREMIINCRVPILRNGCTLLPQQSELAGLLQILFAEMQWNNLLLKKVAALLAGNTTLPER